MAGLAGVRQGRDSRFPGNQRSCPRSLDPAAIPRQFATEAAAARASQDHPETR